jgi:hypothetical protein
LEGNVDITELVVSKTVKTDYANPNQIAHKVLADRMGKRDPGNKPQSNDRIPYCYIDISNLKCILCNKKVSENNCKCIYCMELFCADHLKNHREKCVKICRFCHESDKELTTCYICQGMYCKKCFEKHKVRKDKHNEIHYDKCKKQLSNKLLQGDMIEHPLFIMENNCLYVNSRGIIKSCDIHSPNPISTWCYDRDYLNEMISKNKMFEKMSIYVCTDVIPYFVSDILPKITVSFYLFTGDSDCRVPGGFIDIWKRPMNTILEESTCLELLNHPKLIRWYSQNCLLIHEKIEQLPITQHQVFKVSPSSNYFTIITI